MNLLKLARLESKDISKLLFEVFINYDLFDDYTLRQKYAGTAHSHTRTIPLRLGKSLTRETRQEDLTLDIMFDELEFADWDNFELFPYTRQLISNFMEAYSLTELGWVTIVELNPNSEVDDHFDDGEYCKVFHRFHICLSCVEGANFLSVGGKDYSISNGDIFTFANKKNHSARNGSGEPRIHLIFDAR